jgi:hypothetical protein
MEVDVTLGEGDQIAVMKSFKVIHKMISGTIRSKATHSDAGHGVVMWAVLLSFTSVRDKVASSEERLRRSADT